MTDNSLTKQIRHHAMWLCFTGLSCPLLLMTGIGVMVTSFPKQYYGGLGIGMLYFMAITFILPPVSFLIGSFISAFICPIFDEAAHPFIIRCGNNTIKFCFAITLYICILQAIGLLFISSTIGLIFVTIEILLLITHTLAVIVAGIHAANGKIFVYPLMISAKQQE
jgi:uncharacterized Tic20 family protein